MRAAHEATPARNLLACSVGILVLAAAGSASAAITFFDLTGGSAQGGGGTAIQLTPPPAVIGNNQYDDLNVRAWDEQQDLVLVDFLILDQYASTLSSNVLGPGSVVSSHYVVFDPLDAQNAIGTLTFDDPVVGIIRSTARFDETDAWLGSPTTTYSIGNSSLETSDIVTIAGNSVTFDLSTNSLGPGDTIRIVTASTVVPGINVCPPAETTVSGVVTDGWAFDNGGVVKQICAPVGDVGDDNFDSFDVFVFEEQQAVFLDADLFLDGLNFIAAGETVSSFYVVWDPSGSSRQVVATLTFPDDIIGVIGEEAQLTASDPIVGEASANYLEPSQRGLENNDDFSFTGPDLTIDFRAGSPGDSIRVLLGSASPSLNVNPCDPGDVTLVGNVTGGSAGVAGGTFVQLCDPIGDVGNDNFQSNDLYAFEEQQSQLLAGPLTVDEPAGTIPAGTWVSSYYIGFDPSANRSIIGSITFPGTVLGAITEQSTLVASDFLGNPTATYLNPGQRGLEGGDSLSVVGPTVDLDFSAGSPGDFVRIVVAGAPPQAPSLAPVGRFVLLGLLVGAGAIVAILRSRT